MDAQDLSFERDECNGSGGIEARPVAATKLRVLIVEDDLSDAELVVHALERSGFDLERDTVQSPEEFKQKMRKNGYDIVLADYRLPGWSGMETVQILRRVGLDVPVIMVSGALGEDKAVECIKLGAADYVLKDNLARLPESVRRAMRERKLREENRQVLEELARSNRDLEQFAYVASHDLQEPLRMVATYTQLLAERYLGKLDQNADKYIGYAVDGALRMQTLVQDLLTFSRVGRGGFDPQLIDVSDVLRTVLMNLQASIEANAVKVTFEALPSVVADRTLLTQLFQNLIANAIKFRGPAAPRIRITAARKVKKWVFSVEDNGIGIAPEHAEIVFAIFKRLHTHEEYPGSGIGLSICKKIVEQHGGRIWVESQPGRGANFKFTLPLRRSRGSYDHTAQN